ncbi:MAG: hypothetical protein LBE44_00985 [Microbacterium hominis]|nr:hypothetical protein [Microbacterium hominis]
MVEGVVYESSPNEAASDPEADVIDGSDKRFTKIKQVPKDRVVGTFEGNWRGEIKWTKKGESVSLAGDDDPTRFPISEYGTARSWAATRISPII